MADYVGKLYTYDRSENEEAYMDFLGIQGDQRTSYLTSKPQVRLTNNGDGTYTLDTILGDWTVSNTFRSGDEIEEQLPGAKFKSTFIVGNSKLVQVQKHPNGKVVTIAREFTPNQLKIISTVEGWNGSAVRYYKAA